MKKLFRVWCVRPHRLSKTFVACFLGLLVVLSMSSWAEEPPLSHTMTSVTPPIPTPDFTLSDMDGEPHSLSDYRGKVVMLNFWATWCPPCKREMPSMERLYSKLKDRGFEVVAVNQFEDPDLVFEFTGRLSLPPTFPILFDRDSRVAEIFKVRGLPTTYLLDKEGNIRYRAIGGREFDHAEIEALITDLM